MCCWFASPGQYPKDFTGFRGEGLTTSALELCGQDRGTETQLVGQALALQESGQDHVPPASHSRGKEGKKTDNPALLKNRKRSKSRSVEATLPSPRIVLKQGKELPKEGGFLHRSRRF